MTGAVLTFVTGMMFVLVLTFFLFEHEPQNERFSNSYSVSIDVPDDESYEILCPVPLSSESKLRRGFAGEVEAVNGDVAIEVVTTAHGPALRIVGHGPAEITWSDKWSGTGGNRYANLSMPVLQNGSITRYSWIYCDHGGVTLSLRSWSGHTILDGWPRSTSITRTLVGTLIPVGWQQISTQTSYSGGI